MKKFFSALLSVIHALLPFLQKSSPSLENELKKLVEPGITVENGSIQAEIEEEDPAGFKRKKKTSISGSKVHLAPEQTKIISLPPGGNKSD